LETPPLPDEVVGVLASSVPRQIDYTIAYIYFELIDYLLRTEKSTVEI